MIWSMKTAQAEHSTEFGLFEQNLASLVKAGQCSISTDYLLTIYQVSTDYLQSIYTGKCTMVKHELFRDARTKSGGELYVVKRLAGR